MPFVTKVLSQVPGRQLVALREVRLEEDRYLRDHTLGRDISAAEPDLAALPVMPLTMSMEMLAEAAVALVPGRRLVGMRDVRAHRWLALEGETLALRIVATARAGAEDREVAVQIFEGADASASAAPIVEGIMVLGDSYPAAPLAGALALRNERPSKWAPERLYADLMFHGPVFRGVVSMDRWGEDGAEATLRISSPEGLFASTAAPALATDPVLMDQPGQVVGFWIAEYLETGRVVFPFHLEALHLYGPAASGPLKCQARIALVGDQQVRSDLDVVDSSGRVRARLVGWWDRRFDVPEGFLRFIHAPREVVLSERWPGPVGGAAAVGGLRAHRLAMESFPPAFFSAHGGLWQRALAHVALGSRERERWRQLRTPEPRRLEWLLGRVAAKDVPTRTGVPCPRARGRARSAACRSFRSRTPVASRWRSWGTGPPRPAWASTSSRRGG
ncbi:MAG: hypothetical protein DMF82_24840 [Acidobacteria bacterium]|nr:MAG: hypothetical protein DMF82_24840 [Acidobacteriota bacterium]